jgi:hypothetical protein
LEALLLTQEKIVRWLEDAGWWVANWADEDALVGYSDDDLLILAHKSEVEAADPTFELYDRKRGLSDWVRVIPTPRVAAQLLYGTPRRRL